MKKHLLRVTLSSLALMSGAHLGAQEINLSSYGLELDREEIIEQKLRQDLRVLERTSIRSSAEFSRFLTNAQVMLDHESITAKVLNELYTESNSPEEQERWMAIWEVIQYLKQTGMVRASGEAEQEAETRPSEPTRREGVDRYRPRPGWTLVPSRPWKSEPINPSPKPVEQTGEGQASGGQGPRNPTAPWERHPELPPVDPTVSQERNNEGIWGTRGPRNPTAPWERYPELPPVDPTLGEETRPETRPGQSPETRPAETPEQRPLPTTEPFRRFSHPHRHDLPWQSGGEEKMPDAEPRYNPERPTGPFPPLRPREITPYEPTQRPIIPEGPGWPDVGPQREGGSEIRALINYMASVGLVDPDTREDIDPYRDPILRGARGAIQESIRELENHHRVHGGHRVRR